MGESSSGAPYEQLLARHASASRRPRISPSRSRRSSRFSTQDARPRQPLRGGPGGRARYGARAEPRRRADRVRGRGQDRQAGVLRRRARLRSPSGARSSRPLSSRSGSRSARRAPTRGRLARPADHRHAALPAERRAAPLRRLAEQHLRRPHVHVAIRGADRAVRSPRPAQLAPRAARRSPPARPSYEGVDTKLHSARTQVFTRFFPRCGVPDAFAVVGGVRATTCASSTPPARWTSRRSSGGASVRTFPSRPSRSGSATHSPTSGRPRLSRRSWSRSRRACARAIDDGEPLPEHPHRLIEENTWRAIRHGLSGELIDLERGDVLPARARVERLLEWVQPVAEEIGAAPWLRLPERNAAERQIARHAGGRELRGDLRRAGRADRLRAG